MRPTFRYIGVVALGWLVVSVAAEGAFRLLGDRQSLDLQHLYSPFANGNYKLAPNVDTAATWSSGRLTVHTDQLGLRCDGDRVLATRPGDMLDAVLLGDSQGFGNGVSFEDSLAGSAALAAARDGHRIANASVGGHSAASQLQLAEWLHLEHGVKAANYVLLVTPAIAQSGEHLNVANVGSDGRLYGQKPGPSALLRVWTKTHLVTYARVRDAVRNGGIGAEPAKDVPFVFGFYATGTAENRLRESFSGYLRQVKQFAAYHGARVHIVYVPLTLEMEFEPIRASAAARGLTIDRDAPLRACTAAAQALDIPLYNLRPILESLHAQGDPLHLAGDFHYNPKLSRACGAQIWESLRPALNQPAPIVSLQR